MHDESHFFLVQPTDKMTHCTIPGLQSKLLTHKDISVLQFVYLQRRLIQNKELDDYIL